MNVKTLCLLTVSIVTQLLSFSGWSVDDKNHAANTVLIIKKIPYIINGKKTELYRIEQPDGTWGFYGKEGDIFDALVKNDSAEPTVVHWHGLIVPNSQDGVPYVTQPPILPGKEYHYHFPLIQSGTYWMHSHASLQEQQMLSAPFIIADPEDKQQAKEVVMFLNDFSYKTPETIYAQLKNPKMQDMDKMNMDSKSMSMNQKSGTMSMDKPDLTDVDYDAFLTNYKTLADPEVIKVKAGEVVRLRIIAGSAMSNFFIYTNPLEATAIAIDGQEIQPIKGTNFQLAVGQRIDLIVKIPPGEGFYPILAQGEGTNMQTGLILKTEGAKTRTLNQKTAKTAGALNYAQEYQINPLHPLQPKKPDQTLNVSLNGDMVNYIWTLNNQAWPKITPLHIKPNGRIEIVFTNETGMSHPMHLHGHTFQVTEIDGKKLPHGAMRDTILVLPHSTVKIQFDSDNPGNWMMHCHMLYHQEAGMMTFINYDDVKEPDLSGLH